MRLLNLDTKNRANGEPFQCNLSSIPVDNVRNMRLLSVELPLCWYSVRSQFNTFWFSLYDSFDVLVDDYIVTLTPGNYTAADFCDALQTAINAVISNTTSTVSINDITNKITISLTNSYSLEIHESGMSKYIMGFRGGQSGSNVVGDYICNLNHDLYIYVVISNLQTSYMNHPMTFKIPVTENMGSIQTLNANDWFNQTITLENTRIFSFNISVFDRYGYLLNNNGQDFSLTFELN